MEVDLPLEDFKLSKVLVFIRVVVIFIISSFNHHSKSCVLNTLCAGIPSLEILRLKLTSELIVVAFLCLDGTGSIHLVFEPPEVSPLLHNLILLFHCFEVLLFHFFNFLDQLVLPSGLLVQWCCELLLKPHLRISLVALRLLRYWWPSA
jgi:hypothetical protein